jgi:hypothetical protein
LKKKAPPLLSATFYSKVQLSIIKLISSNYSDYLRYKTDPELALFPLKILFFI